MPGQGALPCTPLRLPWSALSQRSLSALCPPTLRGPQSNTLLEGSVPGRKWAKCNHSHSRKHKVELPAGKQQTQEIPQNFFERTPGGITVFSVAWVSTAMPQKQVGQSSCLLIGQLHSRRHSSQTRGSSLLSLAP